MTTTKKSYAALLACIAAVGLVSVPASASTRFSAVGAMDLAKLNVETSGTSTTFDAKMGLGGGALIEFGIGRAMGLEIGALYVNRKIDTGTTLFPDITTSAPYVEIPVALRFWLSPNVSLVAGGYYALAAGDVTVSTSGVSASVPFGNFAKNRDYGALAGLGFNFPITPSLAILAEGRYHIGLMDIDTNEGTGNSTKWSQDIQALVGFRFGGTK